MPNSSMPISDEVLKLLGFSWVLFLMRFRFNLMLKPHAVARLHVMPTFNAFLNVLSLVLTILEIHRVDLGINVNDCVQT
jgi:hypothetical protein